MHWISPFWIIIGVDSYIFLLLIFAALKWSSPLPDRWVALLMIPALFLVIVMSFANLYTESQNIKRVKPDNTVEILKDPWNGTYFSLVTITTLGYGDYTPQEWSARKIVIGELLSGVLFHLFVIPVLAFRLSMFDEPTGTETLIRVRQVDSEKWEVQENGVFFGQYEKSQGITITLVAQGKIKVAKSG